MKPLPQSGSGSPHYDTSPHPRPFLHALSFSLEETGTDQTNPAFSDLEGALYSPCPIWLDGRGTGQWKRMEEVQRPYLARTACVPLFCTLFTKGGSRRAFRLPGEGGGSFPLYGGTFAQSYSVSI